MSKTISANEAKNRFGTWLAHVNDTDEEIIIESDGKPKAVIMSFEAFEAVEELRERERRAEALERLYAIRDERERRGIVDRKPPEISPERRAELLGELRALREEVQTRNQDLTQEEADEIANRFSREIIDDMAAEGKVVFERDLRQRG